MIWGYVVFLIYAHDMYCAKIFWQHEIDTAL